MQIKIKKGKNEDKEEKEDKEGKENEKTKRKKGKSKNISKEKAELCQCRTITLSKLLHSIELYLPP